MIPELNSAKFLPLFTECIKAASVDPDQALRFTRQKIPLECQILTTVPELVVSDRHHSIICEFTKDSIVAFKKAYPLLQLKDLRGKFLILQDYAPHSFLRASTDISLALHVYLFTVYPSASAPDVILGNPRPLLDDPDMTPFAEMARRRLLRKAIEHNQTVNQLPQLEDILAAPDSPESSACVDLIVRLEDGKKKKRADEHKAQMSDNMGERLIDYTIIEEVERVATVEAARQREEELEEKKRLRELRKYQRNAIMPLKGKTLAELLRRKAVQHAEEQKKTAGKESTAPKDIKSAVVALLSKGVREGSNEETLLSRVAQVASDIGEKPGAARKSRGGTEGAITEKRFKKFMRWKTHSLPAEHTDTNVTDALRKTKVGTIKVELESTHKAPSKAFGSWISSNPPRHKRSAHDVALPKQPSTKKSKLGK